MSVTFSKFFIYILFIQTSGEVCKNIPNFDPVMMMIESGITIRHPWPMKWDESPSTPHEESEHHLTNKAVTNHTYSLTHKLWCHSPSHDSPAVVGTYSLIINPVYFVLCSCNPGHFVKSYICIYHKVIEILVVKIWLIKFDTFINYKNI